jgi:hypothetical protein
MAKSPIKVEYNASLDALEELLSDVTRPGDFHVSGLLDTPLPRLDIAGVGVVSFPLPAFQAREIIGQAAQAPYGRGEETIVDTTVRKVWQVPVDKVRLSGAAWTTALDTILARVTEGLGCQETPVSAELYKLLLYEPGGFFVAHRDTEKAEGMFGTLVISLPSFHTGGELVIRHAGREVTADLSTPEVSRLTYVAFYADCQHEVRPIREGNRLCLVYNLIQRADARKPEKRLVAPEYSAEIAKATQVLANWAQRGDTVPKIVYLLEHQYTPAGLRFAALKNADAAVGKVLTQAAMGAGYAVHLGIVHIEETGPAEVAYDPYARRSRWNRYSDEGAGISENANFEVVDISESSRFIDSWMRPDDQPADFGQLPLGEGELLPAGALDDEVPDSQRVTEATGNEGATFERSYHRAALVLWRRERYPEVLLQSGVGAVVPYLKDLIAAWSAEANDAKRADLGDQLTAVAEKLIETWAESPDYTRYYGGQPVKPADRSAMLGLLNQTANARLVHSFIEEVVTARYDGSENTPLVQAARLLGAKATGDLLGALCEQNFELFPGACVDLLRGLMTAGGKKPSADWLAAHRQAAHSLVKALAKIEPPRAHGYTSPEWHRRQTAKAFDAKALAGCFQILLDLELSEASETLAATLIARPALFVPDTLVVPALVILAGKGGQLAPEPGWPALWQHAADFLLKRGEVPPAPPVDWTQKVKVSCICAECGQLARFAANPVEQVSRFRVREDRRRHVEAQIQQLGLDMSCVTEKTGSPKTLLCTKNRRTYLAQCEQYKKDILRLRELEGISHDLPPACASLLARARAASDLAKVWASAGGPRV